MKTIDTLPKPTNRFLRAIGASSWGDAALCGLVYTFLILLLMSLVTVTVTFVGSFFSGLINSI